MGATKPAFTTTLAIPKSRRLTIPSRRHAQTWMMGTRRPSASPKPTVLTQLTRLNTRVQTIKCPFWRRRFSDSVDGMVQVATWAVRTRHKSLPLPLAEPPSSRSRKRESRKLRNLSLQERLEIIRGDFEKRQYYVTGRLTTSLYRDDCLFDGPDPDGRVRGVRKFSNAAAGLFDVHLSRVDLIDIYIRGDVDIVAEWRLQGALMLPWRPCIKPYVGTTVYSFDGNGLVCSHVETWRISVVDAFLSVVWKGFGAPPAPSIEILREDRKRAACLQHAGRRNDADTVHAADSNAKTN